MAKTTCSVDGCEAAERTRGWCSKHYQRVWKTGSPDRPSKVCSMERCGLPHKANGLCRNHYMRLRRTGTTELLNPREPGKCIRGHDRVPGNLTAGGTCKACLKDLSAAWREAHPERCAELARQTYKNNRVRVIARSQQWKKDNAERVKELSDEGRARRKAADPAGYKAIVDASNWRRRHGGKDAETVAWLEIIRHDPCCYCGDAGGTVDHIEASSKGGPNHWTNYASACRSCNTGKHTRSLLTFLVKRSQAAA